MKKTYIFFMILFCLSLCGCKTDEQYIEEGKKIAIETLNEKYNEDFIYDSDIGCHSEFSSCLDFGFYIKSQNKYSPLYNQQIHVTINNLKSKKNKRIYDNYITEKYKKNVQELIEKTTLKYFENARVFDVTSYGNSLIFTDKTTLTDYLLDNNTEVIATIELKESEFSDSLIYEFKDNVAQNVQNYHINIIISKDDYFGIKSEAELFSQTTSLQKNYIEMPYYAKVYKDKSESITQIYRENLVSKKYEQQLKDYLDNIVKKHLPNAVYVSYFESGEELYDLDINSTFEEYLNKKNTVIAIKYKIRKKDYLKESLDEVLNEYVNAGLEFDFMLYLVDDDKNFEDQYDYLGKYPGIHAIKKLNEDLVYQ